MSICSCGQVDIPLGMTMLNDPKKRVTHGVTSCVGAGTDWERRAIAAEAEVERLTAAIQRVREVCSPDSEWTHKTMQDGYCVVLQVIETRDVLRALDGESDE